MKRYLSALPFSLLILFQPGLANTELVLYAQGKKYIEQNNEMRYQEADKKLNHSLLRPYLRYYYYKKNLNKVKPDQLLSFIRENEARVFANELKTSLFINQLKNNNTAFILKNAAGESSVTLQCIYFQALIKNDPNKFSAQKFEHLWQEQLNLPSSCLPVEQYWLNQHAHIDLVDKKIERLITTQNFNQANTLIQRLTADKKNYYSSMIQLIREPQTLTNQKKYYKDSSQYYTQAILQWGRKDSTAALTGLDFVLQHKLINNEDYQTINNQLAVYQAGRSDAVKPLERIKNIPVQAQSDEVKEWGFRLSALNKDCTTALNFLNRLSPAKKEEPVSVYWTGRMHECLGQKEAARNSYLKIASHISFYGFLAADKVNYAYDALFALAQQKAAAIPLTDHRFKTAILLFQAQEPGFARREWMSGIQSASAEQKHSASLYAFNNKLYDLGLRAAVSARYPGGLYLRYPMAYTDEITKYANRNKIPRTLVWGLTRQESLFQADVKSHADAYGLMQLLIPTAAKMASRLGEKRQSVLIPDANIRYGTAYLVYVGELTGRRWPYILASYNAGPHKVKNWMNGTPDDMALWIETIPYKETRGYVKNVLENAIIYHAQQNEAVKITQYLQSF